MVYFLGNKEIMRVKIGYASNVKKRVRALQTSCPVELILLGSCAGDITTEKEIHKKLEDYRVCGEWFNLSKEVVEFIQYICEEEKKTKIIERKKKILKCHECADIFEEWDCEKCGRHIRNMCKECHMEIFHDEISVLERHGNTTTKRVLVEIDSDGSWGNAVRMVES